MAYKHDNKDIPKCYNNITINIILLDSLLWHIAKGEYISEYVCNGGKRLMRLKTERGVVEEKINASLKAEEKLATKRQRINHLYKIGEINEEQLDEDLREVKSEQSEISKNIIALKEECKRIDVIIANYEDEDKFKRFLSVLKEVEELSDLKRMQEIIREFIFKVSIMDIEKFVDGLNGKSKMKEISVDLGGGYWQTYYAYNFSDVYLYWDEDKNPIPADRIKIIRRELG